MKFLPGFRRGRGVAEITLPEARERVRSLCEGFTDFHKIIGKSREALAREVRPEGGALQDSLPARPEQSDRLLEPLKEYERRAAGGGVDYGDVAGVLSAGGNLRDCLPAVDNLLKAISTHLEELKPGSPEHERLSETTYNLLAQRIYNGGKPAPDIVSSLARGLSLDVPGMQRVIDRFYRENVTVNGNGKTRFEWAEALSRGPDLPGKA
jgi:hypothetical protein